MNADTRTRTFVFGSRAADGRVPVVIATTQPVQRDGFLEVLDCSPQGVDLSRQPLPLVIGHDTSRLPIGVAEDLRALGDRVVGFVRFGTSPAAQQAEADVAAGVLRGLSVGYRLTSQGRESPDGSLVFAWMPYEVSAVSVPADPGAGFNLRSMEGTNMAPANNTTNTAALAAAANAPVVNASALMATARRFGAEDLALRMLREGRDETSIRAAVLEDLVRRDVESGGHVNRTPFSRTGTGIDQVLETLVERLGGKPKGETLRSLDAAGLALRTLEGMGVTMDRTASRDKIISTALMTRSASLHTTSDFPNLLGSAVNRVLIEQYEAMPAALRAVARLQNSRDFRGRQVIRMQNAPDLLQTNEAGEFKYGTTADATNTWAPRTFGRIIALSRQALVNDDLDGFGSVIAAFAQSAVRLEADQLTAILLSPGNVDGAAMFSAPRSSLITGAGSALGIPGLSSAVAALRAQREGGSLVSQEPAFLVVPAALETTARQLVAQITANQVSSVQPYSLTVVVEPRLDATSTQAWYLVAGNQRALEFGYLDGAEGPQTFLEEGFEVDGLQVKCRVDFGCGWVAPVGWVRAAGA